MLLFAADNVDHNIVSLVGKGTFHGMGMIAAVTPGQQVSQTISRQKNSEIRIIEQTEAEIIEYQSAKGIRSKIEFKPLNFMNNINNNIDV